MDDFDTTWLDGVAASAGVDALTPEVVEALLDAAGRAARDGRSPQRAAGVLRRRARARTPR